MIINDYQNYFYGMNDPRYRKRIRKRKQNLESQKPKITNWFLMSFTIIFWVILGITIFTIDPILIKNLIIPNSHLFFVALVFTTIFLTLFTLLKHPIKSLVYSLLISALLFMRIHQILSLIHLILISAIVALLEFTTRFNHSQKPELPVEEPMLK